MLPAYDADDDDDDHDDDDHHLIIIIIIIIHSCARFVMHTQNKNSHQTIE